MNELQTLKREKCIRLAAALTFTALLYPAHLTATAQSPPATDAPATAAAEADDAADRFRRLLETGEIAEAERLASERFDDAELAGEAAAVWSLRLSQARLLQALHGPIAELDPKQSAALEPLKRVLSAYPDHPQALRIELQKIAVDVAVARRRGLAAKIAPAGNDGDRNRLEALAVLVDAGSRLTTLRQKTERAIADAFASRDRSDQIDRWMDLRNRIVAKRVEVLLWRGEMFPPQSDDSLAAAVQAEEDAREALGLIRDAPALQNELMLLRAEALLLLDRAESAAEVLEATTDLPPDSALADRHRAVSIRAALDRDRIDEARQTLDAFYGTDPEDAPPAPETDAAQLHFLLRTLDDDASAENEIADWVEAIRRRNGEFAAREAEQIVSAQRSGDARSDVRLVVAEAGDLLRRGQPAAAAELLARAARNAAQSDAAIRAAIVGAAAFERAESPEQAAGLLSDIAAAHADHPQSGELELQSAVLLDQLGKADEVDRRLEQLIESGEGAAALKARQWLVSRHLARGDRRAAAEAASPKLSERLSDAQWRQAVMQWIQYVADVSSAAERLSRVDAALQYLNQGDEPGAAFARRQIAALFLDRDRLPSAASIHESGATGSANLDDLAGISTLLQLRRGSGPTAAAADFARDFAAERDGILTAEQVRLIRRLAAQRLIADGRADPSRRRQIAEVLSAFAAELPAVHLQSLVWLGRSSDAVKELDRRAAERFADSADANGEIEPRTEFIIEAAKILSEAEEPETQRAALTRLNTEAERLTKGSIAWHRVRIASLDVLISLGEREKAQRLAKYTLLTTPPNDPELARRYETR